MAEPWRIRLPGGDRFSCKDIATVGLLQFSGRVTTRFSRERFDALQQFRD